MLHPNTQILIEEWRLRRGSARLPLRTALSPAAYGPLFPQVFVLGLDAGAERFRLAGGLLQDLHGRDLRNVEFSTLWAGLDRPHVLTALADARRLARLLILRADAVTGDGDALALEIAVCPLIGPTDLADRSIGLYQPIGLTARLAGRVVERLHLTALEWVPETPFASTAASAAPPAERSARAALKLVVDNSRRVA